MGSLAIRGAIASRAVAAASYRPLGRFITSDIKKN
jgi:hypothetical protein